MGTPSVFSILRDYLSRKHLALWGVCSLCLALSSSAYGFLVGPLTRSLFGGGTLSWPPLLISYLPPPPSIQETRNALPWLLGIAACIKALSFLGQRINLAYMVKSVGQGVRSLLVVKTLQLTIDQVNERGKSELGSVRVLSGTL